MRVPKGYFIEEQYDAWTILNKVERGLDVRLLRAAGCDDDDDLAHQRREEVREAAR